MIPIYTSTTNSKRLLEDELPYFAELFAKSLKLGDVVILSGDMGAGKTTFMRHLIEILAPQNNLRVSSPTFTILQNYQTPFGLVHHFDLFRLHSFAEFMAEDFLSILHEVDSVSFLEWGDRFAELKTLATKQLHFERMASHSESERCVSYSGFTIGTF